MKTKIKILSFFIFIFASINIKAQFNSIGIGGNLGISPMVGNFPAQTGLSGTLLLDVEPDFLGDLYFRFSYSYIKKLEYFLPDEGGSKYYPFEKTIAGRILMKQNIGGSFFIEEGLGVLVLNDRTFSDINEWNLGVVFNLQLCTDLIENKEDGFILGIGSEFGATFTNTNAGYYSVFFQAKYTFNL
ncbi:MAG: hypothetical protein JW866_10895 [Ignavibacteriales bacterium]|nr:hypothetical protein [Ignavibacteriales bacterium]